MLCSRCKLLARRFGRNRNGSQRYRCNACARTLTDEETRPADRRLQSDRAVLAHHVWTVAELPEEAA